MANRYFCPPLGAFVELNDERREHILKGNVDGETVLDLLPLAGAEPEIV